MDEQAIINLKAVRFQWSGQDSFGLCVPDFRVKKGESLLLLGESGSGKSTVLSLICGTILAQRGAVLVQGTELKNLSGAMRDRFRAEHIGVVFQQFNLLPFGSVLDNVLLPLQFAPERKKRCANAKEQAQTLCQALGLAPDLMTRKAAQLSVGQQQRVAVARALIGQPPILIADEPTSALDETAQEQFLALMFAQIKAQDATLLMVSHDPRLGKHFDRVLDLSQIVSVERGQT